MSGVYYDQKEIKSAEDLLAAMGVTDSVIRSHILAAFRIGGHVAIAQFAQAGLIGARETEEERKSREKVIVDRAWKAVDKAQKEGTELGYRRGYQDGLIAAKAAVGQVNPNRFVPYERIIDDNKETWGID